MENPLGQALNPWIHDWKERTKQNYDREIKGLRKSILARLT
jgi:hypothetical protein